MNPALKELAKHNRIKRLKKLIEEMSLLTESSAAEILEVLSGNVLSEEECGEIKRGLSHCSSTFFATAFPLIPLILLSCPSMRSTDMSMGRYFLVEYLMFVEIPLSPAEIERESRPLY